MNPAKSVEETAGFRMRLASKVPSCLAKSSTTSAFQTIIFRQEISLFKFLNFCVQTIPEMTSVAASVS